MNIWDFQTVKKNTAALIDAIREGRFSEVERLLPISDPEANDSAALEVAAQCGHVEIVKLLLPVSAPQNPRCVALVMAVSQGHVDVVKLLLPFSDAQKNQSYALQLAVHGGNAAMIDLLIPVSDYQLALKRLSHTHTQSLREASTVLFEQRIAEYETRQQRQRISAELTAVPRSSLSRKI